MGAGMRIQFLNGGLANQAFQYIFGRFGELYNPQEGPWIFDDSYFYVNHIHNGFELEKIFGLKLNLASTYFDTDVWEELLRLKKQGVSLPQAILDMGIPIAMLAESVNYKEFNPFSGEVLEIRPNEFHPEITRMPLENVYYHGYWLHKDWFTSYKDSIRKEFTFPPLKDDKNIQYAERIHSTLSVGVHIRRGDYVTLGIQVPEAVYSHHARVAVQSYPDCVFFVFSDDVAWCRSNAEVLGLNLPKETVYVEGNVQGRNYIDLQLLSMCKGMILSNSAFCFLAALLGRELQFVLNPTRREL